MMAMTSVFNYWKMLNLEMNGILFWFKHLIIKNAVGKEQESKDRCWLTMCISTKGNLKKKKNGKVSIWRCTWMHHEVPVPWQQRGQKQGSQKLQQNVVETFFLHDSFGTSIYPPVWRIAFWDLHWLLIISMCPTPDININVVYGNVH